MSFDRHYLDVTLVDLRAGGAKLAAASDAGDFSFRTLQLAEDGRAAFGFAGDLIGRQCPMQLEADTDTLLYPFMTTTPTSPAGPTSTSTP